MLESIDKENNPLYQRYKENNQRRLKILCDGFQISSEEERQKIKNYLGNFSEEVKQFVQNIIDCGFEESIIKDAVERLIGQNPELDSEIIFDLTDIIEEEDNIDLFNELEISYLDEISHLRACVIILIKQGTDKIQLLQELGTQMAISLANIILLENENLPPILKIRISKSDLEMIQGWHEYGFAIGAQANISAIEGNVRAKFLENLGDEIHPRIKERITEVTLGKFDEGFDEGFEKSKEKAPERYQFVSQNSSDDIIRTVVDQKALESALS